MYTEKYEHNVFIFIIAQILQRKKKRLKLEPFSPRIHPVDSLLSSSFQFNKQTSDLVTKGLTHQRMAESKADEGFLLHASITRRERHWRYLI